MHSFVYGIELAETYDKHPSEVASPCVFASIETRRLGLTKSYEEERFVEHVCVPYRTYKAAGSWLIWAARLKRDGNFWRKGKRWSMRTSAIEGGTQSGMEIDAVAFDVPLHRLANGLKVWLAANSQEEYSVTHWRGMGRLVTYMSLSPANVRLARRLWKV